MNYVSSANSLLSKYHNMGHASPFSKPIWFSTRPTKPVLELPNKLTSNVVVCFILTLQDVTYAPKITVGLLRWFLLKRHSYVIYSYLKLLEWIAIRRYVPWNRWNKAIGLTKYFGYEYPIHKNINRRPYKPDHIANISNNGGLF